MKNLPFLLLTTLFSFSLGSSAVMADVGLELSQPMVRENGTQYHAQRSRRGNKDRGQRRIIEQLNLSDEQTQQLVSIRQKYQPQLRPLQEQIRTARQEMRQMMTGNGSQAQLRSKHQEINRLNQEIHTLRFESFLEMREVLTPEQRQEFAQLMEQRREMQGRRGRPSGEDSGDLIP